MQQAERKSLKLNFIMNAILPVSSVIFPLISFPYVSRVLMPEGVGKVNLALSVISYFNMFAQSGIPTYGIKACAKVRDDKEALTVTVHELVMINLLTAAVTYIALAAALALVPKLRAEKLLYTVVSGNVLFSVFSLDWMYQGLEEYSYITTRSVILKAVSVAAVFLLVRAKSDYIIYAGISVISGALCALLNLTHSRKYISFKWMGGYHLTRHLKPVLIFFALACTTTIYTNLDNVMLGFMTDDMQVGLYSTAVKIKNVLVAVITSLGAVLLPRASYCIEHGLKEEFEKISRKAMRFVLLAAVPLVVYFILCADESILLLAGENYEGAVPVMQVLMPTVLFIGITNLLGFEIMVPTGREKAMLCSTVAGAAVDVILNSLLIPKYAAVGAAIGTLAAEFTVLVCQLICLRGEAWNVLKEAPYLRILLAVISAAVFTVHFCPDAGPFLRLAFSAVFFAGIYGLINLKEILKLLRKEEISHG